MKKYVKKITAYDLYDGFTVEVDKGEFYLFHKDFGDKMHMFGLPGLDSAGEEEIIEATAGTYIAAFENSYSA